MVKWNWSNIGWGWVGADPTFQLYDSIIKVCVYQLFTIYIKTIIYIYSLFSYIDQPEPEQHSSLAGHQMVNYTKVLLIKKYTELNTNQDRIQSISYKFINFLKLQLQLTRSFVHFQFHTFINQNQNHILLKLVLTLC